MTINLTLDGHRYTFYKAINPSSGNVQGSGVPEREGINRSA
jgi:hypothetical protein